MLALDPLEDYQLQNNRSEKMNIELLLGGLGWFVASVPILARPRAFTTLGVSSRGLS